QRWVGTVRRELLDRVLIFGQRHLESLLSEYVDHYNSHRPHRSLRQAPPLGPARPPLVVVGARVVRRARPGGLIGEYSQAAQVTDFLPPAGPRDRVRRTQPPGVTAGTARVLQLVVSA